MTALGVIPAPLLEALCLQGGQLGPQAVEAVEIENRESEAFSVRDLGEHRAPGIDDHRVAVARAVAAVLAPLGGGQDVTEVLDRAGAQEDFPVVAAGAIGEGGGDGKNLGA